MYSPLHRGFESHIGFWTGHHDYYDHTAVENQIWGFDIRRNMDVAYDLHGQYTTDIVTTESVRIIHAHNASKPLFLYVAHAAVHSGNPYNPLPADDETVSKFAQITDFNRRKYAGEFYSNDKTIATIQCRLRYGSFSSIFVKRVIFMTPIGINKQKTVCLKCVIC